ncbi:hypothetical protein [Halobacterium noricense]|uniref:hypothetical protein n=1 Tax=Halobacterium noricense TaxID=223182 RepID=UPI001E56B439|nr:hypothetical protein [Halobacterium noricense]UHH24887.1 hypothetical protein LT974_12980 [Halobacterium noricense]
MSRLKGLGNVAKHLNAEWVAKIIILLGIWAWGPLFGGLEMQANVPLAHLVLMSLAIIFANRLYEDILEPLLSPDGN